eukprot:CAMPEP_0180656844 /NCGR_PEP_ID=MMETSP1037_2-20121125/56084_1 /TAXON_ID=632150 /ORGANISM="Azadinium spinosum, Strain 3D9" /LENGTH=30 /DNA_ID= /DNA_START= /DNA_END= /DNA_ORIENTATION=
MGFSSSRMCACIMMRSRSTAQSTMDPNSAS